MLSGYNTVRLALGPKTPAVAQSPVDAQLPDVSIRYEALTPADASAMTAEARMRLLSGLKRFFHSKRAEGLVSGQVCPCRRC